MAKRIEGGSDLTGTGQVLGTPSYMPPEQAAGNRGQIGPASDVYSLGAILYELLTGRPPFRAANALDTLLQVLEEEPVSARLLNPKIDADLETICAKCLQKESGKRYATAQELADDLAHYMNGEPIHARPISNLERGWRWCRRNPMVASLSAAVAVTLIASTYFAVRANVNAERLHAVVVGVPKARAQARRSQSKNNLKQIGLAMHYYHDEHGKFPPAASMDKNGKQLLSWRVLILPFVGENPLYQQFHLGESWDSEHNKTLIARVPEVYVQPTHADLAKDGKTVYLVPTGEGTAFEGNEGLAIQTFRDRNTILAVEANRDAAVIWTKPDDLVVDSQYPLNNLMPDDSAVVFQSPLEAFILPRGFHILMCDGTVHFFSVEKIDNINGNKLKSLFTRDGGEVVDLNALDVPDR